MRIQFTNAYSAPVCQVYALAGVRHKRVQCTQDIKHTSGCSCYARKYAHWRYVYATSFNDRLIVATVRPVLSGRCQMQCLGRRARICVCVCLCFVTVLAHRYKFKNFHAVRMCTMASLAPRSGERWEWMQIFGKQALVSWSSTPRTMFGVRALSLTAKHLLTHLVQRWLVNKPYISSSSASRRAGSAD